jgi:hypothetical protein
MMMMMTRHASVTHHAHDAVQNSLNVTLSRFGKQQCCVFEHRYKQAISSVEDIAKHEYGYRWHRLHCNNTPCPFPLPLPVQAAAAMLFDSNSSDCMHKLTPTRRTPLCFVQQSTGAER